MARATKTQTCKYPWNEWTNGEWWSVVRGVDFTTKPEHLRIAILQRARFDGRRAQTHVEGDVVEFQFFDLDWGEF